MSLTACSSEDDSAWTPPSARATTTPPAAPKTSPTVAATDAPEDPVEDPVEDSALPRPLVGAWESNEGTGTIAYRFTADGRYLYAGILATPTPEGVAQITLAAEGTATADGDTLLLEPTRYTISREDPGDPAGNYTDRPGELTPERHTWSLPSEDVLALMGEDGVRLTLRRQSP
ncbi:hypothetical protein [Streptomyces lincolnensis]|uniref:hypothetical protein n=1 Tax=Streptomyces lincolnensis TaxID=1915 RepID=UPI0012603E70|nr:hypothetical protein [Streptomyces lincolnensis]QMV09568.1 hypothetical protein GJU35_30565 [Streptomyces lincolnensis]